MLSRKAFSSSRGETTWKRQFIVSQEAFVLQLFHFPPRFIPNRPNQQNCSVRYFICIPEPYFFRRWQKGLGGVSLTTHVKIFTLTLLRNLFSLSSNEILDESFFFGLKPIFASRIFFRLIFVARNSFSLGKHETFHAGPAWKKFSNSQRPHEREWNMKKIFTNGSVLLSSIESIGHRWINWYLFAYQ